MESAEYGGPPADKRDEPSLLFVRGWLFLSSYAPLFVILAIRFQGITLRIACGVLAVLGFLYLMTALWVIGRFSQSRLYPVAVVADASGEVAGYLATYIVPFVVIPSPSAADVAGYVILALVILSVFVRSNLAQINPALYLLGWRIVSVTVNEREQYLVCRRVPRSQGEIHAVRLAGLLIQKGPSRYGGRS
jgi:hypothetical protein